MATMMQITTVFSCGHRCSTEVAFSLDQSEIEMKAAACQKAECQARPLADVLGQRVTLDGHVKSFIKHTDASLVTAGMQAEGCLRIYSNAEPMLGEDLAAAGCTPDMVQAFLRCSNAKRSTEAANYTGHRAALAMLRQYRVCFQTGTSQWQADELMHTIQSMNNVVQQKLAALQQAQGALCALSYPAPGAWFSGTEGVASFQPTWGDEQIGTLRQSFEGRIILASQLTNENILKAKMCIRNGQRKISDYFACERAAYFNDYPGVEKLQAVGKMKTPEQLTAEIGDDTNLINNFTGFFHDPYNNAEDGIEPEFIGVDGGIQHNKSGHFIRMPGLDLADLPAMQLVASKAMASSTLTVDFEKAHKS